MLNSQAEYCTRDIVQLCNAEVKKKTKVKFKNVKLGIHL